MTNDSEFHATKRIIQAALDEYSRCNPRPSGEVVAEAFAAATLAMWRALHGSSATENLTRFLENADRNQSIGQARSDR